VSLRSLKLAHRNAIITGASVGLGRVIAQTFVREGANVLLCARGGPALAEVEAQLRASCAHLPVPPSIRVQECDVSSEREVRALFARADAFFPGPLHVLVNNAGIYGPKGPTDEVSLEEWRRCLDINLFGTLIPCREAMHRFKKAGGGKIVNLSGGGATNPMPNLSAYAAAKAAVVRLTETLALELQPYGVDVNAVAPGALNTRLLDEVIAAGAEKVGADFYRKSLQQASAGGVPLELGAELCAWLASNESDGITGKLLSAKWDPWKRLQDYKAELLTSDIYALRRITPEDRGKNWPLDV
jgi:NAD(P)-dependent dehydrogenase (short-subunit alcohol dehydrogenase family)